MTLSKMMLKGAEVLRPVLVKVIPKSVLSRAKARVIEREAKGIGDVVPFEADAFAKGINLIGDIRVDTGLGESMRYVSSVLDAAGIPNLVYNYFVPPGMNMSDHSCDDKITDELKYGINIFHINANEMPLAYMNLGREFFDRHYNIGFWLWELTEFPAEWMPTFNLIDELWVPSEFERSIFEKYTDKPVYTVPYPVAERNSDDESSALNSDNDDSMLGKKCVNSDESENESVSSEKSEKTGVESDGSDVTEKTGVESDGSDETERSRAENDGSDETERTGVESDDSDEVKGTGAENINQDEQLRRDRREFGLPEDKFLFLMMYDGGSGAARKNPGKVIESFRKAFAPEETGVGLVVKLKENSDADIAFIRENMSGYNNVYYLDKNMSRDEVNRLIACADVYVSLHRAEGFGLVCAEAMTLGTPVVATAWSATTDFMNEECACMVDYEMMALDRDYPPFRKGWHWAEADSDCAAKFFRKLFEDNEFYDIMKSNAYRYVHEKLSMKRAAEVVKARFCDIDRK